MSPVVADAAVAVRGDLSPFKRDLQGAGRETEKLGKRLDTILSPKNLAAGFLGGAAVAGLSQIIEGAISDASDLAESTSKVEAVFGDASEAVMDWAETSVNAYGLSKRAALEAAGTYGNLFQAFGIGAEEAQKMSMELVELAADLASFNNTSVEDALLAIRSGLSGEAEPLKRYGVALNQARLEQVALNEGIWDGVGALDAGQKAQASYALIMEDTILAQGDAIRTGDGLAMQQKKLEAALADVSAELGEKMLPIVVELVTFLNEDGIPILREFLELLDFGDVNSAQDIPILGEIEDFLNGIDEALGRSGRDVTDILQGRVDDIAAAAEKMGLSYTEMRERITDEMDRLGVDHETAIDNILRQLTNLGQFVPENLGGTQAVYDAAVEMADGIPKAMSEAREKGEDIARQTPGALANQLRAGIEDYDAAIDELAEVAAKSVSDLSERQKIEGILASKELTDALNSDSTRTRLLAMDLVNDLISDYELLAPGALESGKLVNPELASGLNHNLSLVTDAANAMRTEVAAPLESLDGYPWGYNIGDSIARGMWDSGHLISDAAYDLANRVRNTAGVESEPRDPHSPLRGITKWGGNLVHTYLDGILHELGLAEDVATAFGRALVPTPGTPGIGFAPAAAATAGVMGGPTYNVELVDRLEVRTVEDIGHGLRRMGEIGLLPGVSRE